MKRDRQTQEEKKQKEIKDFFFNFESIMLSSGNRGQFAKPWQGLNRTRDKKG